MDTVSQIKQNLDVVDIVGGYLSLKRAGKNYKALCPFHSEDTPSFMVSPELQIYKCFGCGEAGDMFNFVQKVEGVDFNRSLEILADKAGVKIERTQMDPNYKKKKLIFEINSTAADFYHHLLTKHKVGRKGLNYLLKKRDVDAKTINRFKIGYAPDNWDTLHSFLVKKGYKDEDILLSGVVIGKRSDKGFIDKFRGRIVFPFIDINEKIVGFSGRDIVGRDPKYLNTQDTLVFNKSGFVYGLDKAKVDIKKKGAILVEGQMDVIKAFQKGITNAVAVSGTSLTSLQLKIISRYTKELILSFDSDEAGMSATARALSLAEPFDFEIKVTLIPEKYADLDDFLNKSLRQAKKALESPVPIYDFYFANALKNYNKGSAYGKKKIVEYLAPIYSKITNSIVLDHYVKRIAEEIDVTEEVVRESLKDKEHTALKEEITEQEQTGVQANVRKLPEEYFISLLIKSDLDTMGQFLYKLKAKDFFNERNKEIFGTLKSYIDSKPREFDIKYFRDRLDDNYKEVILEMYLWDFGEITVDKDLFVSELDSAISRIEKNSIKRKLKELTEQIKLAELEKNAEAVKELSKKFARLSKKLI